MIGKLLNFIVGREPVAAATGLAGGVGALLGVLAAFDVWDPTPEQVGALTALAAWVAGYMARRVVTPVAKRLEPAEHGSVPLAVILGIVFFVLLVGAFFATCDALFDDEDEEGDLGQGTEQIAGHYDHDESERNGRNGNDCNQSENCSDDDKVDFRPVICVQPGSCQFGPDPQPT